MRKYQHYGLYATQEIADVTRKILETSGMEKFCRDPGHPDEPPVITAERIEFANRELSLARSRLWYFLIVDKETHDAHWAFRAKQRRGEIPEDAVEDTDINWDCYGDTNAEGIEREVWALLIWARMNLSPNGLENCYVRTYLELYQLADFYEQVFGVPFDEELLAKAQEKWYGRCYNESFEEAGLSPLSLLDMRRFDENRAEKDLPSYINNLSQAAEMAMFYNNRSAVRGLIEELFGKQDEYSLMNLLTFGYVDEPNYEEYYPGTKLRTKEKSQELVDDVRKFIKLWNWFSGIANKDAIAAELERRKKEHEKNLATTGHPWHRVTQEERDERARQDAEYLDNFRSMVGDKTLGECVNEFISANGFADAVAMIGDGVPIEDIIA